MPPSFVSYLLVAAGGALGSCSRYALAGMVATRWPGFPWGTLAVNAIGSYLIGAILQVASATTSFPPEARIFLTVGVMGGFTTYSTFSYETVKLLQTGNWAMAAANAFGTLVLCVGLCWIGIVTGRAIAGGAA